MNKKLILIGAIILIIGIAIILVSDNGTTETQLAVNFDGEWEGYYQLTLDGAITLKDIEGGSPLNFTIKRENGDKLEVFVKAKNNSYSDYSDSSNTSGRISLELIENGNVIAMNSTNDLRSGVVLLD